jgi:hypothetical protein
MISQIKQLLTPMAVRGLQRYGGTSDGGYVFKKDLFDKSKFVYSYGVGPNDMFISFDKNAADLGKDVYLYDASIPQLWDTRERFHFKSEYVNSNNIMDHIMENGHQYETDMVLKMDIEGCEYETLINTDSYVFSHFSQIGLEAHDVVQMHSEPQFLINADDSEKRWENKIKLFSRLNHYYHLVHVHGNNNSTAIIEGVPDVVELTYIRKDMMDGPMTKSNLACPVEGLDFPNSHSVPEIKMNWWL